MNIAIYDPDTAERRPWSEFIGSYHTVTELMSLSSADRRFDLLFAHGSYLLEETFNSFRKSSPSVPLVVISGGPPRKWWEDDNYSYWRKAIVGKPGRDFIEYCHRFLSRMTSDGVLEFALLEPSFECELAFGLLCEAKHSCERNSKKDDYKGTGITIHAPQSIWEWIEPFGITTPEGKTTKADAQIIDKVAALMGCGLKDKARAVLEAVNAGQDPSGAIRDFLGIPESTSTQP